MNGIWLCLEYRQRAVSTGQKGARALGLGAGAVGVLRLGRGAGMGPWGDCLSTAGWQGLSCPRLLPLLWLCGR